jgi:hypothetical protein
MLVIAMLVTQQHSFHGLWNFSIRKSELHANDTPRSLAPCVYNMLLTFTYASLGSQHRIDTPRRYK